MPVWRVAGRERRHHQVLSWVMHGPSDMCSGTRGMVNKFFLCARNAKNEERNRTGKGDCSPCVAFVR